MDKFKKFEEGVLELVDFATSLTNKAGELIDALYGLLEKLDKHDE